MAISTNFSTAQALGARHAELVNRFRQDPTNETLISELRESQAAYLAEMRRASIALGEGFTAMVGQEPTPPAPPAPPPFNPNPFGQPAPAPTPVFAASAAGVMVQVGTSTGAPAPAPAPEPAPAPAPPPAPASTPPVAAAGGMK